MIRTKTYTFCSSKKRKEKRRIHFLDQTKLAHHGHTDVMCFKRDNELSKKRKEKKKKKKERQ